MDKKIMYANNVEMAASPFDITVKFLLTLQEGGIEDECRIILSPTHAKAILGALSQTINTYEELFGKIAMPLTPEKLQELAEKGIIMRPGVN